jgi:CBS domain-containing protein
MEQGVRNGKQSVVATNPERARLGLWFNRPDRDPRRDLGARSPLYRKVVKARRRQCALSESVYPSAIPASGWSINGAKRSQPVATGGKWESPENGLDKPKPLQWVATGCRSERMVRRGSTVRVRAAKTAPIVPETKPLDDLLADLQRDRTTLAVVADEYGSPAGIVTVEDIVEEIVGEIADETDPVTSPVRQLANGDWYARGDVPIDDLTDYGIELPSSPDYTSIGGLVFGEFGRLAAIGDIAHMDGYTIRVESVRGHRITAVRIREHRADAAADEIP